MAWLMVMMTLDERLCLEQLHKLNMTIPFNLSRKTKSLLKFTLERAKAKKS